MRGPIYRYNTETCNYERSGITVKGSVTYALGLCFCALFMLAGMMLLHDYLVDSPKEKSLRKENTALEKYSTILHTKLNEVEFTLASLQDKDAALQQKLFASIGPRQTAS